MTLLVSLITRIDRVIMELSVLIVERPGLAWKSSKTSELLWEKPFQDQDLVAPIPEGSLGILRMNSFVPKAILHW